MFDCDGVLLNSNSLKTDAFYKSALDWGASPAKDLVNYHVQNGGISRYQKFDYFLVFLAGLFNDAVVGLPLGISSLSYILICIFATYLRNITISPNLIKDWFYFLFIISLINSINFSVLFLFFSYELDITLFIVNNFFTFLFYIIFSIFFKRYLKSIDD